MAIRTYGTMAVDWEQRVDFDRLRRERLARANELLERSELGALLCFDMSNIRYITATHIGTWAMDKLIRFCLLPRDGEPIMWDFGSAARHHKLYCPWLGEERSRAGISTLRGVGQGPRRVGRGEDPRRARAARPARRAARRRHDRAACAALRCSRPGITVVDGQALMQDVRNDQDGGRDHAAEHGLRDGRLRLRRALSGDEAGLPRERLRRARQQGALRARLGARRGRERDLRRALLAASARVHRSDAAAGRARILRHPPRVQRLSHVLLPHVRRRLRLAQS